MSGDFKTWHFSCSCGANGSMDAPRAVFDEFLIIWGGHHGSGHQILTWPRGERSEVIEWVAP